MKYIIILLTAVILAFAGCATKQSEVKTFHLLHVNDNLAYKSVTHDDYIIKEDC